MVAVVSAIGSASFANYAAVGSSSAGLQAQLDQYRQQLANWVTCASCNTIEGKNKIEQISARIGEIETQMKAVDNARGGNRVNGLEASATTAQNKPNSINAVDSAGATSSSFAAASGSVGSNLDIFA